MHKVIVIGGGPAGMMAAITAAKNGSSVTLLERNDILGKKLLITGKGRCNLTNSCDLEGFIANIPVNARFMYSALKAFDNHQLMEFFENRGVKLKEERGGRIFPESDRSQDIQNALIKSMKTQGVEIITARAVGIKTDENGVCGVLTEGGKTLPCDSVILATGGKSYPLTGSTGDGYTIAKDLGHDIIPPKPSLVPLEVVDRRLCEMQGLSLKNTGLKVKDKQSGKVLYEDFGEMMFTHFGITGPMVLSASAFVRNIGGKLIELDLKPALSEEKLEERIRRDFERYSNKDFVNALTDLLPSKMIPHIAQYCNIPKEKKINQITRQDRHALIDALKHFTFEVKGTRPIAEAIVTSGGVSVKQIKPSTMESKIISGLFFAGEIIDVDAYTGGFNLQIAFSTGYIAGMNA